MSSTRRTSFTVRLLAFYSNYIEPSKVEQCYRGVEPLGKVMGYKEFSLSAHVLQSCFYIAQTSAHSFDRSVCNLLPTFGFSVNTKKFWLGSNVDFLDVVILDRDHRM